MPMNEDEYRDIPTLRGTIITSIISLTIHKGRVILSTGHAET